MAARVRSTLHTNSDHPFSLSSIDAYRAAVRYTTPANNAHNPGGESVARR